MTESVIEVENLSKCYRIGAKEEANKTFRETVVDTFRAPMRNFRRLRDLTKFEAMPPHGTDGSNKLQNTDIIWALKDVSFEVKEGEVLGIIGRNGAGKSTLLKILSQITEPTAGDVRLYGRVSSLLEVGTGFHPELTGRENIFLNGAILGMRKGEITKKFDEIVSFAEIEKFIDTPVKRYSSGMYVRLAFAVAAHLEPEIMVVDEVLAVGDAQFQKKCLGKMQAAGKEGRTVLFVSHNMAAISRLCHRALLLEAGQSVSIGNVSDVIGTYLSERNVSQLSRADLRSAPRWDKNPERIITWISLHRGDREEASHFSTGDDMIIKIGFEVERPISAYCQVNFLNYLGDRVMVIHNEHTATSLNISGRGYIECVLPEIRLLSGDYTIMLELGRLFPFKEWLDCIPEATRFNVDIGNYLGGLPGTAGIGHGTVAQKSSWKAHADGPYQV
jgi:lipopolysaccharide transport system ATP-binding protein